mmetsp:Transcript_8884/g.21007  ORF Transcript_8884/g.21007 Transcript_8884/m.21007 type:complete len:242 (+) Transcript_8884:506-1231(+)
MMSGDTMRSWSSTVMSSFIVMTWYTPVDPDQLRTLTPCSVKLIVSPGMISLPCPVRMINAECPSPSTSISSSSCVMSPSTLKMTLPPLCIFPLFRSTNDTTSSVPASTLLTSRSASTPACEPQFPDPPKAAAPEPERANAGSLGLFRFVHTLGPTVSLGRSGQVSTRPVMLILVPAPNQVLPTIRTVIVESAPIIVVLEEAESSENPGISLASNTLPVIGNGPENRVPLVDDEMTGTIAGW